MAERLHGRGRRTPRPAAAAPSPEAPADAIDQLRSAASAEDDDGNPIGSIEGVDPSRPIGPGNPPRKTRDPEQAPRPSRYEVERRVAEAQLWVTQRLPMAVIVVNARTSWGVRNIQTVYRYLDLARRRMVEELITDRRRHQAEQIFALNECARRAMDAEQFSAAVGAFRVIAEIGGLLRAPVKPPEPRA
jgi:hypothetical protein